MADITPLKIKYNGETLGTFANTQTITLNTKGKWLQHDIVLEVEFPAGSSFDWGNETATADAQWFADLKSYLASHSPDSSWVGKTKSVTLTTEVLGTTTHLIQCIGVNQDGVNTVTFQTKNMLANAPSREFGINAVWMNSFARQECQNYYNAFPGKDSIKTVSKGTCPNQVNAQDGTATYNNETVFLLSPTEVGYTVAGSSYASNSNCSSLDYIHSTTSNSECTAGYNETYGYYVDDNSRIKNFGDSGSAGWWWLRSREFENSYYVCNVYENGYSGSNDCGGDEYIGYTGLAPAFVIGN